jgi:hypothetical protein
MRIISFDPGEITGFCEAEWLPGNDDFSIVKSSTINWSDRFAGIRDSLLGNSDAQLPSVVIAESFRLYAGKARDQINNSFPSVHVIGIISTYMFEYGILDRLVLQPASVMSRVMLLKEHVPSLLKSEHARDAYRHLRYYIVTKKTK